MASLNDHSEATNTTKAATVGMTDAVEMAHASSSTPQTNYNILDSVKLNPRVRRPRSRWDSSDLIKQVPSKSSTRRAAMPKPASRGMQAGPTPRPARVKSASSNKSSPAVVEPGLGTQALQIEPDPPLPCAIHHGLSRRHHHQHHPHEHLQEHQQGHQHGDEHQQQKNHHDDHLNKIQLEEAQLDQDHQQQLSPRVVAAALILMSMRGSTTQ